MKIEVVTCACNAIWLWERFKKDKLEGCPHCKPGDWNFATSLGNQTKPIGFLTESGTTLAIELDRE